jgi:predicted AAA+ superfamily ATPase
MPAIREIPRHAQARVLEALWDTRIVAVEGPRQAGKSTALWV